MKKITLFLYGLVIVWVSSLSAATVKQIIVEGNERVNKDYIFSLIHLKEGDKYREDLVSLSIKDLYNTDRFSHVEVNFNNPLLIFKVKETPMVNKVIFIGNKNIKENILKQELTLTKNLPFSERKLSADRKRIKDLYLKSGFLSTNVATSLESLKYNRVNVIFSINEGKKSKITSIKFIGNNNFSTYVLKKVILTKEDKWWRILNPNYIYDANRISYDGELLRQFYNDNGYIDFNLLSFFAVINSNNQYQLIFNINEGQRFKFGPVKLDIKINKLQAYKKELLPLLDIKNNSWFSKRDVDGVVRALEEKLKNLGYTLTEVQPKITLNTFLKKVYITFEIVESKLSVIERINITGNTRTYDNVIRRSLTVREGDAFTQDILGRSRTNVYNLGYFSDVKVTSVPGSTTDRTFLNIDVTEQSTGYISLGGGYSTYDGFMLQTTFSEQNILGSGNGINLSASLSQRQLNLDATFFNPYLFNRKVYGSIRVFDTVTDYTKYSSYKLNQIGVSPVIGYKLSNNLSQTFTYLLGNTTIFNVKDNAPLSIKQSAGSRISSILSHNIQYDRRDNTVYTLKGYLIGFNTDIAGLGGDVYYLRDTLNGSWYQALCGNIVLSAIGSVGYINKIKHNKNILISDKFFLGGSSLRGFDWSGVGPRDNKTKDALGGNFMVRLSEQIDFPIPLVDNFGLLFHIFNDNGSVYNIDSLNADIVKFMDIRSSIGFGISWRSPFGIIGLDWGWPIKKLPQDRVQRFLLSFGARI